MTVLRLAAGLASAMLLAGSLEARADAVEPGELVFLLQYVGTDYGVAVHDGRIADRVEYAELTGLSQTILESYTSLRPRGSARSDLTRLGELIRSRAPWEAVRASSRNLAQRIGDELDVTPFPTETPDVERGRELYREDCAPCHGAVGGGDGPSSPYMTPRPTSFRGSHIALYSPHQMYGATRFGIPGTGMPYFRDALTPRDLWDLSFFVMTLRDGFNPSEPAETLPLTLREIAAKSDEEILARLRASRPGAAAAEVDYYRAQFRGSERRPEVAEVSVDDSGLAVAERLERTFARVAGSVFPGVVGVSVYEKGAATKPGPGWQHGVEEEELYPGFHRTRAGSGFLVSGDGDVMTYVDAIGRREKGSSDIIDVELTGNVHCRARVIGIEPTIDLAVLKIAPPVPVRSLTIGDSDRVQVGNWAIAVGDPPGAGKTFAPGTIAARPERECYQEHRTSTLLQSSVVIEPAGFGGPLVNLHGEVIGLTLPGSATVSALPINLAMTIYRALKVKESDRSPWIGISVLELSAALRKRVQNAPLTGIYIDDVFAPSPASRAGIRVGDVLTKMDDHAIVGVSDFQTWLYLIGIDAPVALEIDRRGETLRKSVTIEQRPDSATTR